MDFVLVKIANKKDLVKILSDDHIFPDFSYKNLDFIAYDHDYHLDDGTWFEIKNLKNQDFCPDFLHSLTISDSKTFSEIKKEEINTEKLKYLVSCTDDALFFQKITASLLLKKKHLLAMCGDGAKLYKPQDLLVIKDIPDAVYIINDDRLIFRTLSSISSIFKGIEDLYREATDTEVQQFLKSDFIDLKEDFSSKKVSIPNRKRIALVQDRLNNMALDQRQELLNYLAEYKNDILKFNANDSRVEISTDVQLKHLLYGIDERYYTTALRKEKRLANSVQRI
ncbi:ATP F0F1 synthase synthase [Moraxella marmotae]|uniref:ATP F0F1 synthase synthase n=1 Tax=Moraxella marmotae TaxID=3344520 RepID=UPI0035F38A93